MILFQFFGAPGSGKSTAAADLYAALKKAGYQAELVGEAARDFIYQMGKQPLFDNQFLISGLQWERVVRLNRCDIEVAVSDSPVIQGLLYSSGLPYFEELKALLKKCDEQFVTYNIFIRRATPYVSENRNQTEEESNAMVPIIRALVEDFWMEVDGNEEGLITLRTAALTLLAKTKMEKFITRVVSDIDRRPDIEGFGGSDFPQD